MAVTLNQGNNNKLIITIPAKGDTDWAGVFQAAMQAISDHDHSGNGKGSKITGSSLEDGCISTAKIVDDAVTGDKIANNSITADHIVDVTIIAADVADNAVTASKIGSDVVLSTLNDVSSTSPGSQDSLEWNGSEWAPTPKVQIISTTTTIDTDTSDTTFILTGSAYLQFFKNTTGSGTDRIKIERCRFLSDNSATGRLRIGGTVDFDKNYINMNCSIDFSSWQPYPGRATTFTRNHGQVNNIIAGQINTLEEGEESFVDSLSSGEFSYNNLIITGSSIANSHVSFGTVKANTLVCNAEQTHTLNLWGSDQNGAKWYSDVTEDNHITFLAGGEIVPHNSTLGHEGVAWRFHNDKVTTIESVYAEISVSFSSVTSAGQGTEYMGITSSGYSSNISILNTPSLGDYLSMPAGKYLLVGTNLNTGDSAQYFNIGPYSVPSNETHTYKIIDIPANYKAYITYDDDGNFVTHNVNFTLQKLD